MTARPSMEKRRKEKARLDRKIEKAEKRNRRKVERSKSPPRPGDVDPDIAHIVPGPQPIDEGAGEI